MRRLITILLLLVSFSIAAQTPQYFVTQTTSGVYVGGGVILAPQNPYGRKQGWIFYLHGIDHRRARPTSLSDISRISVIEQKGTPKIAKAGGFGPFQKPGGGPTEVYYWNVAYIQCDINSGQWVQSEVEAGVKYIKDNYAATTDVTLFVGIGYSLGGGGFYSLLRSAYLRDAFSYVVIVAGGYINTPNYPAVAASGLRIDVYTTIGDALVSISLGDNYVKGVRANDPVKPINLYRLNDLSTTSPDHDVILWRIIEDVTPGDSYMQTNGELWIRDETPYEKGLRYSTKRPHR